MRRRAAVVGLALLVFGLPAALGVTVLVLQGRAGTLEVGPQPGGPVLVRAVDATGAPVAGAAVEWTVLVSAGPGRAQAEPFEPLGTTGEDGEALVELPPVTGLYVLRVGGGSWVWREARVSLLDEAAPVLEEGLELVLAPGGELLVRVARGGAPAASGTWVLERPGRGLSRRDLGDVRRGDLEDGTLRADGLAAGTWSLHVEVDGGMATFEVTVEVPVEGGAQELLLED